MINLSDCDVPNFVRVFDIEAISVPIVYNKYGNHDPNGLLYVLKKDSERIQRKARENFEMNPPQPYKEVQPLVIRANVGDKVRINFYNKLNRNLSIHVQGLKYDVMTSDGANVGCNKDTTTDDFISYTWYADREGVFLFSDMADTRSSEAGTNVHGLFGAIIIEKAQSTWFDPITGEEIESGLFADVYNPIIPAFREYAVFFHDELEIKNKDGEQPIDPHTGLPNGTTGISYRSEPMRNRPPLEEKHDAVTGEDISMSSWTYGDPSTPILKAYTGERVKIRLVMPADKPRNIGFAIHGHSWRSQPDDPFSNMISVRGAISVGGAYNIELEDGASEYPRDYLYRSGSLKWDVESGMWGIFRVMKRNIKRMCENICRTAGNWWQIHWYDKYN